MRGTSSSLRSVWVLLALLALGTPPGWAQSSEEATLERPYLVVLEKIELEDAWVEVTPLLGDGAPVRLWLGDVTPDTEEPYLQVPFAAPSGPVEVCSGAAGSVGVRCASDHLDPEWEGLPYDAVPAEFLPGVVLTGQYVLGDFVVPGARVALVPEGLSAPRPFTVPLAIDRRGRRSGEPVREVETDREGRFALPPVAEGSYFLETILPTGRVHRSEVFEVDLAESLDELPRPGARREGEPLPAFDLGILDVAEGLDLEVRVADPSGRPVLGAEVSARQGRNADDLETYQTVTGASGVVRLSGFRADLPATVRCEATGFRSWRREFEIVPVVVLCDLEPLAWVQGTVLGPDGQPVPGAVATLEPVPEVEEAEPESRRETDASQRTELGSELDGSPAPAAQTRRVDGAGGFRFSEVLAGTYRFWLAAPGHERIEQTLEIAAGEGVELGTLALMAGREVTLRVIDAELGTPVAEAQVLAESPPGAVDGVTDSEGELVFATGGEHSLRLRVEAENYALEHVTLTPESLEGDEAIVLALERPGWIHVVVWDEARNAACTGCSVWIRPGNLELVTDGFGDVLSPPLRPGTYQVYRPRLDHLGSTVVEQRDAEMRWVRVERGKGSKVQFGEQREGIRVRYSPPVPPGWTLVTRGRGREARYHREADGGFLVRQQPGEHLELWLRYVDPEVGREVELAQGYLPPTLPGGRGEATLPRHDTSIRGRAHHPDGSPVARVPVRLLTLDHRHRATGWTHDDGTFLLPHVEPGAYALHIGNRNLKFVAISPGLDLDTGTFLLTVGSY